MASLRVDVVTLFPGLFEGFLSQSVLKRAIDRGIVEIHLWDPRQWCNDKHKQLDDRPFGGGAGMVLMAPPMVEAVERVRGMGGSAGRLIALSPRGPRFDQRQAEELAFAGRLILVCGRYEGFDERILELLEPELVSVGDYVLSGGEVAAMVVIDAAARLVPGVMGDESSACDESFGPAGTVEYPQYTRPRRFRGLEVPGVLLGGDHAAIRNWRDQMSRELTSDRLKGIRNRKTSTVVDECRVGEGLGSSAGSEVRTEMIG